MTVISKLNQKTKLILVCILVTTISAVFFIANYKVYWSPFEILSHSDIEQNQQGVCLAEDRKLDNQELFVRAMQSYWDKRRHSALKDINYEGEILYRCRKQSLCEYWKIPEPLSLEDYTKAITNRPDAITLESLLTDYFDAELFEEGSRENLSQHNNGLFPYSILALEHGRYSFLPSDCCQLLTDRRYASAFVKQDPEENIKQQQRGNGHYFIRVKDALLGDDNDILDKPHHLRPEHLYSIIYPISNCGELYGEFYGNELKASWKIL